MIACSVIWVPSYIAGRPNNKKLCYPQTDRATRQTLNNDGDKLHNKSTVMEKRATVARVHV